jgi:DNA-binding MarR family transcriptional regulator
MDATIRRFQSEDGERVSSLLRLRGLTRLVERLEREKLVDRQVDLKDGRAFHAVLTDAGLERLNQARTTHNAVIRALFLDRLTPTEQRRLGAAWSKVLAAAVIPPQPEKQQRYE